MATNYAVAFDSPLWGPDPTTAYYELQRFRTTADYAAMVRPGCPIDGRLRDAVVGETLHRLGAATGWSVVPLQTNAPVVSHNNINNNDDDAAATTNNNDEDDAATAAANNDDDDDAPWEDSAVAPFEIQGEDVTYEGADMALLEDQGGDIIYDYYW